MTKNNLILGVLIFFGMFFSTLVKGQTIKIGTQVWMTKNLNVDKFRNGDPIPESKTTNEWQSALINKQPAWCYYNNDSTNSAKYGKLYNWYALIDKRGLAPEGWQIPTKTQWVQLIDYLGVEFAAAKMKGRSNWDNNNQSSGNGTNESGFNGLPGGGLWEDLNGLPQFGGIGNRGSWWSNTGYNLESSEHEKRAFVCMLGNDFNDARIRYNKLSSANSIRCIKYAVDFNFDQDKLEEIKIGDQIWITKNLNVDKFRNGEIIPQARTGEEWLKAGMNKKPAWCYYDNDPSYGEKYGKLYNWYAVNDPRGLAPEGWHVPIDAEWETLTSYLGGGDVASKKMKSTSGWAKNSQSKYDGGNGTNDSGFSGLPGGSCFYDWTFDDFGEIGCWWSSTQHNRYDTKGAGILRLSYYYDDGQLNTTRDKELGLSVRCVKNQ